MKKGAQKQEWQQHSGMALEGMLGGGELCCCRMGENSHCKCPAGEPTWDPAK